MTETRAGKLSLTEEIRIVVDSYRTQFDAIVSQTDNKAAQLVSLNELLEKIENSPFAKAPVMMGVAKKIHSYIETASSTPEAANTPFENLVVTAEPTINETNPDANLPAHTGNPKFVANDPPPAPRFGQEAAFVANKAPEDAFQEPENGEAGLTAWRQNLRERAKSSSRAEAARLFTETIKGLRGALTGEENQASLPAHTEFQSVVGDRHDLVELPVEDSLATGDVPVEETPAAEQVNKGAAIEGSPQAEPESELPTVPEPAPTPVEPIIESAAEVNPEDEGIEPEISVAETASREVAQEPPSPPEIPLPEINYLTEDEPIVEEKPGVEEEPAEPEPQPAEETSEVVGIGFNAEQGELGVKVKDDSVRDKKDDKQVPGSDDGVAPDFSVFDWMQQ